MLINQVSKLTKLTKKAIEYYTLQGLVCPTISPNGYKHYSESDLEILNKIGILRKLDLSIESIRVILDDNSMSALKTLSVQNELKHQRDLIKNKLLEKLSLGASYEEISQELQALEQSKTITDKLVEAFPDYYERFISLHFAQFLSHPISTAAQQKAYETILDFLDNLPSFDIPKDLKEYLIQGTKHIGTVEISELMKNTNNAYVNFDEWLSQNKELLETYSKYKQSEEYKSSPAYRLAELMKNFNNSNGYNDIFIPAIEELSPSYKEYRLKIQVANEKFITKYPQY